MIRFDVTDLDRLISLLVHFGDIDREIKSQGIAGCRSKRVRGKGLSEPTWTLKQLLDYGRVQEFSEGQNAWQLNPFETYARAAPSGIMIREFT